MSDPYDPKDDAARAAARLLVDLGLTVDVRTRDLLEITWLEGYNAALEYCNERLEQAGVR